MKKIKKTPEDRFWAKVEKTDTCWNWTGCLQPSGYAQFYVNGASVYVHRYSYGLVGVIPDGLVIDHLCRNTRCVNPAHLEPVSHRQNLLRGDYTDTENPNPKESECHRGHTFTEANTIKVGKNRKYRVCRECQKAYSKRYYHKNKNKEISE